MKFPSKIASLLVVGALSLAGLTAVTSAYGDSGRWGHSGWSKSGKHGGKHMCQRGPGGMHHGHRRHGPDHLAMKLSVMETAIGIRANQLDAWRDFTDALLATMKRRPMGPGMGPGDSAEPFSLAEGFADRTIERGKSAEELKAAIAKLKETLTPEQLDKVKMTEAKLRARFQHHHGGGHHGMGPHGGPSAPEAAPDEPDTSGGDDTEDAE